jgi:hypothetical protein
VGRAYTSNTNGREDQCRVSIAMLEENNPLRRYKHRLEDHIEMDRKGIGWESVDWIHRLRIGTSSGTFRTL